MFELHKDEKILLYVRRHWIFLFLETKLIFLLFLVPTIFIWIAQVWGYIPSINFLGVNLYEVSDIIIYLWALFCWMLVAEKFTDYAIDFWVVTNKRIIESELLKLFSRRLSTLELEDIEDITIEDKGFIANLIGYGTLEVQTAGTEKQFMATNVANPSYVQKVIFDAKVAEEEEKMNIEKGEHEQISHRVFKEELNKIQKKNTKLETIDTELREPGLKSMEEYDWAKNSDSQGTGNLDDKEVLENVDAYKKDIAKALRVE